MKHKLILYISKALPMSLPKLTLQLSQICRTSRKRNLEQHINGLICFSKGYFLQVIEGEAEKVDFLYQQILNDNRHSNIETVFNTETDHRFFNNWDMKLLTSASLKQEPLFLSFINEFQSQLSKIGLQQQKLLEIFNIQEDANTIKSFEGKTLKLPSWPDLSIVQPLPFGIELTAALIHSSYLYDELIKLDEFGTKQDIDKVLSALQKSNLLTTVNPEKVIPKQRDPLKMNLFYNKMKKLLLSN